MNHKKLTIVALLVTSFAAWLKFAPNKTLNYLVEKHPNVDPQVLLAVHDQIIAETFMGKLKPGSDWSEEKYNEIFNARLNAALKMQ